MTVGSLTVFLAYLARFFKPVQDLAKMTNAVAQTNVGLERIQAILDIDMSIQDRPDAREPAAVQGRDCVRARRLRLQSRSAGPAGRQLHDRARSVRRRGRADRQRQVDDRQPDSTFLRSDGGPHPDRRQRHPRLHGAGAPPADRLRAAGHGALPRHDAREHRLRAAPRDRRADRRRGAARQRRRVHRQDARRLRHA